ncbi:MAG: hypothetical protein LM572_06890 [Ignisphaera sp.]|nr:hypothetical protein [Ignisphaera sp.]
MALRDKCWRIVQMYNTISLILGVTATAFGIVSWIFTDGWQRLLIIISALTLVLSNKYILPYLYTKKTLISISATGLYLLIVVVTAFATAYICLNALKLSKATSLAIVGVEIVILVAAGCSLLKKLVQSCE